MFILLLLLHILLASLSVSLASLTCYHGMQGSTSADWEEQRLRTLVVTGLASRVSGQGRGDPGEQVRALLGTLLNLGPDIEVEWTIRVFRGTAGGPGDTLRPARTGCWFGLGPGIWHRIYFMHTHA